MEIDAEHPVLPDFDQDVSLAPLEILKQFWGYDSFRPLQQEAVECVLNDQDSLVVLPTGGGKSLCYQVPALIKPGVAIVVSPLISLMKDQVDGLLGCGVEAAYLNSTLSSGEYRDVMRGLESGTTKLLYVSPERITQEKTLDMLSSFGVSLFAIDEAHCISEWGHDFRPEFRALQRLKEFFPGVGVHAYTATATEQVRSDIIRQLNLDDPQKLVGSFDRPNLIYKVQRRTSRLKQILAIVEEHEGESGIVYCISRNDVDQLTKQLCDAGHAALPYHAGLSDADRSAHQESFIREEADIVVATVAFGMGIDKSNIRFVIHAGMPKSLENYQQESGRAGRDGLEAECVLLSTGNDFRIWRQIIEDRQPPNYEVAMRSLEQMADYCKQVVCRHKQLVNHFGQDFEADGCGACDVCQGEVELADEPLIIGQKILSSVVRQGQRFGGEYTALVLKGSTDQRILGNGHDELSTYGLLEAEDKRTIRDWIEQLVGQGFLVKAGDYNVLKVTAEGGRLLKGEVEPKLTKAREYKKAPRSRVETESWEGVDRGLLQALKTLRKTHANDRGVPAYLIFSDATLRQFARIRPSDENVFRQVKGVGDKKVKDFGPDFIEFIVDYCEENGLPTDVDD